MEKIYPAISKTVTRAKEPIMSYKLMNFNISAELKAVLDELSRRKHVSKTSILNSLIATHCTSELMHLRRLSAECSQ